ncbi:MAG: O-antigen ligase family protein, partial [Kiritimatiellae bacterium]|nr:O-antigen ligase family protein [Kiritimatiellia bacterium]
MLEYLVLAYVIFLDHLPDPKIRHRMVFGFLIVSTVILLVGLTQYHTRSVSPSDGFLVRGTFGNRNVFGGFLCLVLPLMFGFALWSQQLWQRIWFLTALLAGASLVLSGGAAVALGLSLLVVALLRGQRTALLFVVGVLLIIPLLSRLPRENLSVAWKSVALYNDEGEVHSRYTEWQAAAEMIRDHPWRGVGIGNYQANIGRYYGILPRPPSKAEPDSQNLYLVIASTTGIPGLLSFLALLGTFAVRAVHAFHLTDEPWKKGAAAGLVGSLLGFAINCIWSPLLVRGMGIP